MKTPYETMFLLPPTKTEEEIEVFLGRLKENIEKLHGEVTAIEKMGVRKTAYQVGKLSSAYYILVKYSGSGEMIHDVERMLRNSDEVIKYLSTKVTTRVSGPVKLKAKDKVTPVETKTPETAAAATPAAETVRPEASPAGLSNTAQE